MPIFLFFAAASLLVSSVVGLGGSLIAVPAMVAIAGPKAGVAIASLLLAVNNAFKLIAYRRTIPWRSASFIAALTMIGAFVGARMLVAMPETWVAATVLLGLIWGLAGEGLSLPKATRHWQAIAYALSSGLASGVSGTSGPLKGMAIRQATDDRQHFAGAASLVSFIGDATKAVVFTEAALLGVHEANMVLFAVPLMPICAFAGQWLNQRSGERTFAYLFWTVTVLYGARLVLSVW